MKFLDLNGLTTLWKKCKETFIPFNHGGQAYLNNGEALNFNIGATQGLAPTTFAIGNGSCCFTAGGAIDSHDRTGLAYFVYPDASTKFGLSNYDMSTNIRLLNDNTSASIEVENLNTSSTTTISDHSIELVGSGATITINGEELSPCSALSTEDLNSILK